MFIFFDISQFNKHLDYYQTVTCSQCGRFGRYEVFQTGNRFRLFFIPIVTFGKQYFVRMTCCGTVYRLQPEVGKAIARGRSVQIREQDLELARSGRPAPGHCSNCGHAYEIGANYCPKCGEPLPH